MITTWHVELGLRYKEVRAAKRELWKRRGLKKLSVLIWRLSCSRREDTSPHSEASQQACTKQPSASCLQFGARIQTCCAEWRGLSTGARQQLASPGRTTPWHSRSYIFIRIVTICDQCSVPDMTLPAYSRRQWIQQLQVNKLFIKKNYVLKFVF